MPTLSLCMIVKNEEEVLPRCLESVRPLADEIIIVDTGSTDSTLEIARSFGAIIHHFEWIDDFAAARNFSFSKATSEYILWLDADDVILPGELEKLLELKGRMEKDAYYLLYDYSQDAAGNSLCTMYRERIIRNGSGIRWDFPIHECMAVGAEQSGEQVPIIITHRRTHAGAAADKNRNLRILEKAVKTDEYRESPRVRYYLAKEYHDHGDERRAIEAYRHFLAMPESWYEDRICAQQRLGKCYLELARKQQKHAPDLLSLARWESKIAIRMDDRWAEPYFVLGQVAFEEEDYAEAIFWFEKCLRPMPPVMSPLDNYSYGTGPLMGLCISCDKLGEISRAIGYNEQALRLHPDDPGLLYNREYFRGRIAEIRQRPAGEVKLNLGSGNKRHGDYRSCDKFPGREVDEVFSLEDIPYADDSVAAIHSEHALEHLYHHHARHALHEWFRVLKPGGELHLMLPDLEACCRAFLAARTPQERDWYRYTIYGIQQSQGDEPPEGQIHYTGFTESELVEELTAAGFHVEHHRKYDGYGTPSIEVYARKPEKPVDIIIPTCSSRRHLLLCIESIRACTTYPHRIIVVNSGPSDIVADLPEEVTVVQSEERLNFARAVNLGIAQSSAPYICLMNDDVIVSRGWLEPLLAELRDDVGLANPLSNCDIGWLHNRELALDGIPLFPAGNVLREEDGTIQIREVDAPGIAPERIHTADFRRDETIRTEWLPFYCTLLRREVIDMVGLLDEEFNNGGEDLDYCRRATRMGYACVMTERSFVFHFGATSRVPSEEDRGNASRIALKYDLPLLVIHTGHSFEPWTSEIIRSGGIGGSETAAARMAEELATLGYRVVVFSMCEGMEGIYNGVEYMDYSRFPGFAERNFCEVFIASRYVDIFNVPVRAAQRYLWLHDIRALGTEPGEGDRLRTLYAGLDGIFCLSPWHINQICSAHGIPADKMILTGNGIDPERFAPEIPKQPNRFIYTSSPDRGLETLLETFPLIRDLIPDAELHIFYGFENWDRSIEIWSDNRLKAQRNRIYEMMKQPGVFYHGRVGQERLAEEFLRSDIWFYPTWFSETYCISALEAQMAGAVCVASDLAALSTTVADRGILIPGSSGSTPYIVQALREVLAILGDPERKIALTTRARAWAEEQTWRNRAIEWAGIFGGVGVAVENEGDVRF